MEIRFTDDDIMVIKVRDGKVDLTKDRDHILVDLDADGNVLEIEVIGASRIPSSALMTVFKEFGLDRALVAA